MTNKYIRKRKRKLLYKETRFQLKYILIVKMTVNYSDYHN
jgi:hypothetical protein